MTTKKRKHKKRWTEHEKWNTQTAYEHDESIGYIAEVRFNCYSDDVKKMLKKLYVKQLDDLVKEIVKYRDDATCQKCLKHVSGKNCHASHVKPKSVYPELRWDLLNVKTLCLRCHKYWWHLEPTEAGLWFIEKFPARWQYLNQPRQPAQFRLTDLAELKRKLTQKLADLKGE